MVYDTFIIACIKTKQENAGYKDEYNQQHQFKRIHTIPKQSII